MNCYRLLSVTMLHAPKFLNPPPRNAMKRATFGLIAFSMAGDTDISDLEYEFRKLDKGGVLFIVSWDSGFRVQGLGFGV